MNNHYTVEQMTEYLFSLDWDNDFTDDELEQLETMVNDTIAEYSWPTVYSAWCEYLHTKCNDDWSVVNFARHYWDYAHERYIPDPIHFIAYLYYQVDTKTNDDAMQIFDSLSIAILENAGLLDMMKEPLYTAERDPRIQAEIEAISSQQQKKMGPPV